MAIELFLEERWALRVRTRLLLLLQLQLLSMLLNLLHELLLLVLVEALLALLLQAQATIVILFGELGRDRHDELVGRQRRRREVAGDSVRRRIERRLEHVVVLALAAER